ncbi:tRNA (adenosine(37)-N6)-threonylcarbamoyltransferase complex dimerization subunit type 1 TsaB [Parvibaculum sedimenti]|nr:tRNA (adenosine(37)-N6)-threonylcarbamoyltransferase complex dimerization subunit type 1 TsaB [Parvibaculum sedimenti]
MSARSSDNGASVLTLLAFDTAQGALSAAILGREGVVAYRFEPRTRGHAENLMPMLEAVMAEAGLGFADLDALAVTIGPGTFTGLRVGLAAARGLALARSLPLVGVTTLEALAEPVRAEPGEAIVAAFDAKRGEIYLQTFDANHVALSEPMLVSLEEALTHVHGDAFVCAGTGAGLLAAALAAKGIVARLSDAPAQPDARSVGRLAAARLAAEGVDAFRIAPAPLYLRAPDAKLPGGIDPFAA